MSSPDGLRTVFFPDSLDTSRDDLVDTLYGPGLSYSVRYDRGVGFFTSRWITRVANGLVPFASHGGKMRLITSPKLSSADWSAIKQGHDARENPTLLNALNVAIDDLAASATKAPIDVLSWMIADQLLDIKIAVPTLRLDGDFHPKLGVFTDAQNDFVAFHGSQNETEYGFRNFETLHVHLGWTKDRDADHAARIVELFDRLWNEHDPNVRCYKLPSAIRKRLIAFTDSTPRPYSPTKVRKTNRGEWKWRHQDEACSAFLKHRAGILAMATGTGKTRTALKIEAELRERDLSSTTIVAAFGTDLLDQWHCELTKHGASRLIYREYENYHEAQEFGAVRGRAVLLINRRKLADLIPRLPAPKIESTLLICDEVHGIGEPGLVQRLSHQLRSFPYRLGLSATPTREYDQDGNEFIEEEIGPVIFRFEIHEAIKRGILCELDYHPIEFAYSDDDTAALRAAWKRHAHREKIGNNDPTLLYMDLAKVKKLSKQKIPPFKAFVRMHPEVLKRCIIFVEQADYGALLQGFLVEQRVEFHTYYGDDDRGNLQRFAKGELECLIACKRISEGIDIHSVNNIVLFATARAPIETVQRVGRCLRTDPNNPNKRATVLDFVRTDGEDPDVSDSPLSTDVRRREWFERLASVTLQKTGSAEDYTHE